MIKFCWWRHWEILWLHNLFFQKTFIFRRPGAAILADIIKIVTMFIKTIFKDSKKFKRIRNYVSKRNLYLYFLILQNLLVSGEKMLMLTELKGCLTWFICFLDLLYVRYNNGAKFHHCRIFMTDFREGALFAPSPLTREQPRKNPSWIRLTKAL